MLRRHKNSELNGRRLLDLPPKTTEVVELDFTPEERSIYDSVEQRMRVKFNNYLKQGKPIQP
jgi:SNF2 family DNA or RNA helicase